MIKSAYILSILLFFRLISVAQPKEVFVIEKVKDYRHVKGTKASIIVSVGVELYRVMNGAKIDSLYKPANYYNIWKDSIIFSFTAPASFSPEKNSIVIQPIYHYYKNDNKSNSANYILGDDHTIELTKLKIKSDPSGADVFLVPRIIWERNSKLNHYDVNELTRYLISEGTTTVITHVQEYVYVAIYHYKDKFYPVLCAPNHLNGLDSVYKKLN